MHSLQPKPNLDWSGFTESKILNHETAEAALAVAPSSRTYSAVSFITETGLVGRTLIVLD